VLTRGWFGCRKRRGPAHLRNRWAVDVEIVRGRNKGEIKVSGLHIDRGEIKVSGLGEIKVSGLHIDRKRSFDML
jgi:hypothetical protein